MSAQISEEIRHAMQREGTPLTLVDSMTGEKYVLFEEAVFAQWKSRLSEDELSETYRAQVQSATRGGWDDPAMDDYNDYDGSRKQ